MTFLRGTITLKQRTMKANKMTSKLSRLGILIFLLLNLIGEPVLANPDNKKASEPQLNIFSEVLLKIQSKFVDEVKSKDLIPGAIAGMLEMADPNGSFYPPEIKDAFEKSAQVYGSDAQLEVLKQTFRLIQSHYANKLKNQDLVVGAIRGMVEGIDPDGSYFSVEEVQDLMRDTKQYNGVGLKFNLKDQQFVVEYPLDGSPSERAGIRTGDRIFKINGHSLDGLRTDEVTRQLMGPRSTEVTLTIRRGMRKPFDLILTREEIKYPVLKTRDIGDGISYVRLYSFNQHTAESLQATLENRENRGIKALVIDLRNNPGGLLSQAVYASQLFLEKGRLITYTKGRNEEGNRRYEADGDKVWTKLPLAVLVNQGTAGGSEIVAGALQVWDKATIVGTPTFGKGNIQTVISLSDGSALKLTTARFYLPKDRAIQGVGITPDIVVEPPELGSEADSLFQVKGFGNPTTDVQLQRAVEALKSKQMEQNKGN